MSAHPTSAEEFLVELMSIYSPGQLIEVAKDLRYLVSLGLLRQVGGNTPLDEIGEKFPYDFLILDFETIPGGTTYRLGCDTYHGSGGSFGKMDLNPKAPNE